MTTWSDESLPSTGWGVDFLLINETDKLLIEVDSAFAFLLLDTGGVI